MKVSRLVSIILILMDKKRISAQELANMFEVSVRTIYRDIEAISMAGIPVHSIAGVGGGFEVMEKYKIDKKAFSEEDLTTILMGISSIPAVMKSDSFIHTYGKINSLIPEERKEAAHFHTEQMHIDFSHWMGNRDLEDYIETIKTALIKSRIVSFEYINHSGEETKRQVEPYQLILKGSQWYFQGYCYKREGFRLFKLTRMTNLKIEDFEFVPKEHPKPLSNTVEILDKIQISIKLRIHESIMERLLDYCDHDQFLKDGKNHYLVTFPFIENNYYYGILLSFGEYCECIEPLHIRTELKRKIANLSKIYEK